MFLHAKHENEHLLQLKKKHFNGVLNYNVLPMGTPKDVYSNQVHRLTIDATS